MKKISILVFVFLYSCAKPTVVEVIQPGDDLLNCTELKLQIEETNKIKEEAEFSKGSGGNYARALLFWPAWAQSLNNADDAMIAANNRSFHLIKLMKKKNCSGADDLKAKLIDKPTKENLSGSNLADQLKTLKELYEDGHLSDEEYTKAKKKIID